MAHEYKVHLDLDTDRAKRSLRNLRESISDLHRKPKKGSDSLSESLRKQFPDYKKLRQGMTDVKRTSNRLADAQAHLNRIHGEAPGILRRQKNEYGQLAQAVNRLVDSKLKLSKRTRDYGTASTAARKATSKAKKEMKETERVGESLWRIYDRLTGQTLRQVELYGLLGGVIVGAQAAYAGLAAFTLKLTSDLGQLSERLNINVEELQRLQNAANISGIMTQDFNQALEDMNNTIYDAVQRKDSAVEAFNALGISMRTLEKRGGDTATMFRRIMDSAEDLSSRTEQLNVLQNIFGKTGGRQLADMVGQTDKAIEAMKQFDLVLKEETVASATEAWNAIKLLWSVLKNQFLKAAAQASDQIKEVAFQLLNAARSGNIFKGTIVPAVRVTIRIFEALFEVVKGLYWAIYQLYQNSWILTEALKVIAGIALGRIISKWRIGFSQLAASMGTASAAARVLKTALVSLGRIAGYYLLIEAVVRLIGKLREMQRVVKNTSVTWKEAALAGIQQFINTIYKYSTKILAFVLSIRTTIQQALIQGFAEAGKQAWESFKKSFSSSKEDSNLQKKRKMQIRGQRAGGSGWAEPTGQDQKEEATLFGGFNFTEIISEALKGMKENFQDTYDEISGLTGDKMVDFADEEVGKYEKALKKIKEAGKGEGDSDALRQSVEDLNKIMEGLRDFDLSKRTESVKSVIQSLKEEQKQLRMSEKEWAAYQAIKRAGGRENLTRKEIKRIREQVNVLYDLKETGESTFDALDEAFKGWANNFSRQLNEIVWNAKTSFKDIAISFSKMITQTLIQKEFVEPIVKGISNIPSKMDWGSVLSSAGSSIMSAFGGGGGAVEPGTGNVASAKGNVFSKGQHLEKFATGGIVNSPTVFPMADGAGLMGEGKRAEAIMPLERTSDNDLGVKAEMATPNVEVNVVNNSGQPVEATQEEPKFDGQKQVLNIVLDAANRNKNGFGKSLKGALSKA